MKTAVMLCMLIALFNTFPGAGAGEDFAEGVNTAQPISPGEEVYSDEDVTSYAVNFTSTVRIKYVYLGITNNSIKVKRTEYTGDTLGNNREKNGIVLLPLNDSKQALLEVAPQTKRLKAIALMITVADDSDTITVKAAEEPEGEQ